MAFVIVEPCVDVKDGECAVVCPVECIPKDPDHEESEEILWEKYRRLIAQAAV